MQCISETSECTGKSAEKPTEQNGIKAEDAQSEGVKILVSMESKSL